MAAPMKVREPSFEEEMKKREETEKMILKVADYLDALKRRKEVAVATTQSSQLESVCKTTMKTTFATGVGLLSAKGVVATIGIPGAALLGTPAGLAIVITGGVALISGAAIKILVPRILNYRRRQKINGLVEKLT